MNELTHRPQSGPLAKTTSPVLTAGLKLLLSHDKLEEAAEEISRSPALWNEVRDNLPAITAASDAAMEPAGNARVAQIVGKRLAIYPQPDRSEAEWVGWWDGYYEALSDLPATAVEAAMREWVCSPAQFLPKPGELRQIARGKLIPEYRMLAIARAALRREPMMFKPGEVEERRAQVAEALAAMAPKPAPENETKAQMAQRLRDMG